MSERKEQVKQELLNTTTHNPELINQMGAQSRIIAIEKYDVEKVNEQMFRHMDIK